MENFEAKKIINYMLNSDSEGITIPSDIAKTREALFCAAKALDMKAPIAHFLDKEECIDGFYYDVCSNCNNLVLVANECEKCGAKMDFNWKRKADNE